MIHSLPRGADMPSTTQAGAATGSAERWGPLWGARPADWALSEDQQVPGYEAALARVDLSPGALVLDVGCGAGTFLRLVADRGVRAFGVDASEALAALARERVPEAVVQVGDMESLPYADETFDLVTGFTSFFFANDIVAALREAGRVRRHPGVGAARAQRPRGDEAGRQAIPPAQTGRRAARARLRAAWRARAAGERGRPHA